MRCAMLLVAVMAFLTSATASVGQDENDSAQTVEKRWSLGITGGALYNMFTSSAGIKPTLTDDCLCPDYTFESEFGYIAGLVVGIPLTDNPSWRLTGTLQLAYLSANAALYAPGDTTSIKEPDGGTAYNITEYRGTLDYSALELSPSVAMFIANTPIAISAGVGVSRILSTSLRSDMLLLLPENARFDPELCPECEYSSDGRTVTFYNKEIPDAASWMFTAIAGVEAHLSNSYGQFVPAFRYRFGLTPLSSTRGLRASALELSLSLRAFL